MEVLVWVSSRVFGDLGSRKMELAITKCRNINFKKELWRGLVLSPLYNLSLTAKTPTQWKKRLLLLSFLSHELLLTIWQFSPFVQLVLAYFDLLFLACAMWYQHFETIAPDYQSMCKTRLYEYESTLRMGTLDKRTWSCVPIIRDTTLWISFHTGMLFLVLVF